MSQMPHESREDFVLCMCRLRAIFVFHLRRMWLDRNDPVVRDAVRCNVRAQRRCRDRIA